MQSKEQLELRKLELEIAALSRPRWLRAEYLIPSLIAAATFLGIYYTGYFDQERTRLKRETEELKTERESLRQQMLQYKVDLDYVEDYIKSRGRSSASPSPESSPAK